MASDKLLENQRKTTRLLAKQTEEKNRREHLDKLEEVRLVQIQTTRALIGFLSGSATKAETTKKLNKANTPDFDKVVEAVSGLWEDFKDKEVDFAPLAEMFSKIEKHLEAIPKEHPKALKQQELDMDATNKLISGVIKAIGKLKLSVTVPDIDIPASKVNITTQKVDLGDLRAPLKDLLKAFKDMKPPVVEVSTDAEELQDLARKSNELLTKITKMNFGGGGGGGSTPPPATGTTPQTLNVTINWTANGEARVNQAQGGYTVYISTTSGFMLNNADQTINVSWVSGLAPTTTMALLASGTHYVRVAAYGTFQGNITTSIASQEIAVTVPFTLP